MRAQRHLGRRRVLYVSKVRIDDEVLDLQERRRRLMRIASEKGEQMPVMRAAPRLAGDPDPSQDG